MMKKILYIALGLAMLTGCSKEIDNDNTELQGGEVHLMAGVQTRAVNEAWEADDRVGVFAFDGTTAVTNGTNEQYTISDITSGAMSPTAAANKLFYPIGKSLSFYAYYPYSTAAVSGATYTVDATDQTSTAKTKAADLMWAAKENQTSTDVALPFSHQMAQLKFTIEAGGVDISDLTGLTATLKGANATAKFDLKTGAFSDEAAGDIALNVEVDADDKTVATVSAFVVPTADLNKVSVVLESADGKKFGWSPATAAWTGGATYTYTITAGDVLTLTQPVSNSYLITPEATKTIYRIPVSRVNEFWKASASDAICHSANVAANVIGSADTWTVALLWQDEFELVRASDNTKITLSKSTGTGPDDYFTLTVPKNYAGRGNFVIAIAKGATPPTTAGTATGLASGEGVILWSWHFWVSDKPSEIQPEPNYPTFMDRNMGARSVDFPTYQVTTDNKTVEGVLYYQFGRKDPFPADVALYYDINGNTVTYSTAANAVEGQKTMAYAVNNPLQFIKNTTLNNWCSELAADSDTYLWNDPNVTDKTKKSLFDPTPVGYRMPINGEFNFMSSANSTWVNKGRKHTSSGLYFPAVGRRYVASGGVGNVTGGADCWSSSPYGATDGRYLSSNATSVYPQNYNNRGYGFPVRCVQE